MKTHFLASVLAVTALAGCWTVSETEYPEVKVTPLPAGKAMAVSLVGFEAGVSKYVPVEGHEQMSVADSDHTDGPYAKAASCTNGYCALRSTFSRRLIDRAAVGLERKGFVIRNMSPDYVIELKFSGPVVPDYDVLKQVGRLIFTVFTYERITETWSARLRIYDRASRKWIFTKDYVQEYSDAEWGPIPVASPACSPKIRSSAASSWALTALTDQAIADASAALAEKAK